MNHHGREHPAADREPEAAPRVHHCDPGDWPVRACRRILEDIDTVLARRNRCSVMLTGGRTAGRLYAAWADVPDFGRTANIDFYFGDERCVPPDSKESNYRMAMGSLFPGGVPKGCTVHRLKGEMSDPEEAARQYEEVLPPAIDVLLLGVGLDGHIASLFPGSSALGETKRTVVPVTGAKPPAHRLTVTPPVIAGARRVFVLAAGADKAGVLVRALSAPDQTSAMPVRLALAADWLMDTPPPAPQSAARRREEES